MKTKIPKGVRARDRLAQLRLLSRFEKSLGKHVSKIIAAQGKTAAEVYVSHGKVDASDLSHQKANFYKVLSQHYRMVMQAFQERIGKSIKASFFETFIQQWIAESALKTIDDIDDTTLDAIRTVISHGQEEGNTNREIAQAIVTRTSEVVNRPRADVIARTEMHTAANAANVEAAKSTELTLNKVWCAALDNRTRDAHADADGQSVGLDDDFVVDGESVAHPGDGSPENSINCRCTVIFEQVNDNDT